MDAHKHVHTHHTRTCPGHPETGGTDIRIAGGGRSGRIEIYKNGEWGTVCDDNFGSNDARVACRQLGFSSDNAGYSTVGGGSGPTLGDDMACTGTESRLQQCSQSSSEDCDHDEDVGVRCDAESPTPQPTLRSTS